MCPNMYMCVCVCVCMCVGWLGFNQDTGGFGEALQGILELPLLAYMTLLADLGGNPNTGSPC